jgi:hypothetical protein
LIARAPGSLFAVFPVNWRGAPGSLAGSGSSVAALASTKAAIEYARGLAASAGMLVGARLGQGDGAAMMASGGLSILTTSFNSGDDRITHLDLGHHLRTSGRSPLVNDNRRIR